MMESLNSDADEPPREEDEVDTSPDPTTLGDRCRKAWKRVITTVAGRLTVEDVANLRYTTDLPRSSETTAVDVLSQLERRGRFSFSRTAPLEELLREVNRHDLVVNCVEAFRREHGHEIEAYRTATAGNVTTITMHGF